MGLVFLKGTVVQPKTVAGISSCGTESPWQVWGGIDSWFRIEPKEKSANFVPASHRVKISNLMGWFFLEGTLVEPKAVAGVLSDDTEGPWQVLGKTKLLVSYSAQKNL